MSLEPAELTSLEKRSLQIQRSTIILDLEWVLGPLSDVLKGEEDTDSKRKRLYGLRGGN